MLPERAVARAAHDREQPGAHVSTSVAIEMAKRSQVGVLDHVFGVALVPQEVARQGVRRVQVGKDRLLESCQRAWVHLGLRIGAGIAISRKTQTGGPGIPGNFGGWEAV